MLGLAVTLSAGIWFASFVAGWALRDGIATSFARMGADLVVVPRATLVNLTSSLLTVQPTDATLDIALQQELAAITGIARIAPQRLVPSLVDGHSVSMIAFDPEQDFSVQPWLAERRPGRLTDDAMIAGFGMPGKLGERLAVCGRPLRIDGRLAKTGVGPFDNAYFVSFDALAAIVAFCRSSGQPTAGSAASATPVSEAALVDAAQAPHAACAADLPLERVSAFLVQLAPSARIEDVKFAIARLPDIRIVEGNTVLTSSRQALNWLLAGIAVFAAVQVAALLTVLSLLFSATIKERYREFGLLRAVGATPNQLMTVVLGEAAIVTGLGGLAGLGLGAAILLSFARSLGFYFDLLGIPFAWPSISVLGTGAVAAVLFSTLLGLCGAVGPGWRLRRMEPYELIRTEAR